MELFRAEKIATVKDHSNSDCRFCGAKLTLLKTMVEFESGAVTTCLNARGAASAPGPIEAARSAAALSAMEFVPCSITPSGRSQHDLNSSGFDAESAKTGMPARGDVSWAISSTWSV